MIPTRRVNFLIDNALSPRVAAESALPGQRTRPRSRLRDARATDEAVSLSVAAVESTVVVSAEQPTSALLLPCAKWHRRRP